MVISHKQLFLVLLVMGLCSMTTFIWFNKATVKKSEASYYTMQNFSEASVRHNRSVFFIETSTVTARWGAPLNLSSRVACAVEAAALLNPDLDVYLLVVVTPPTLVLPPHARRLLDALHRYGNFRVMRISLDTIAKGTPVDALCKSQQLHDSPYRLWHLSDVLRVALLWRFGGVYLDTDTLTLRPLWPLGPSFVGAEADINIANGIMRFGRGHPLLAATMAHLAASYKPDGWSTNGPELLTKMLLRHCANISSIDLKLETWCGDVRILPPPLLYPVYYDCAVRPFQANWTGWVMQAVRSAYTLHLWNKVSAGYRADLRAENKTAVATVAPLVCPRVNGLSLYL